MKLIPSERTGSSTKSSGSLCSSSTIWEISPGIYPQRQAPAQKVGENPSDFNTSTFIANMMNLYTNYKSNNE